MILIRRPDERPVLLQINLHRTQPWRMPRSEVQRDALAELIKAKKYYE